MRASIKCIAVLIAMHWAVLAQGESVESKKAQEHKKFVSSIEDLEVWWARPLEPAWTRYEFKKLNLEESKEIRSLIKKAEIDKDAGDFYLLEAPYEIENKLPQGIFLFRKTGREVVKHAYRFRYKMVNRKALEFVSVEECDFDSLLRISFHSGLWGIRLTKDPRGVIVGAAKQEKE